MNIRDIIRTLELFEGWMRGKPVAMQTTEQDRKNLKDAAIILQAILDEEERVKREE